MAGTRSAYQGCLLGLAVGDAMGFPVDDMKWKAIREDYGPNGLMGFDIANDSADVTSHTQLCAFTANGLLLGSTQERLQGRMAPYVRYIALSQKEWANVQRRSSSLQRTYCWVYWVDQFRSRHCADIRMLDTLALERIGSLEDPINRLDSPCSLTSAVAVGIFAPQYDRLGAEAVALTCGDPMAFVCGALVANLISTFLAEPETAPMEVIRRAMESVNLHFSHDYPQTWTVLHTLRQAVELALAGGNRQAHMESLVCENAAQVLAGAVYTLLTCEDDFDTAMITAVNHSGRSCAVAALAGAMLGARLGVEGVPEFYLESLEVCQPLMTLANDLYNGCPNPMDLDWDRKYLQGEQ